MSRITNRKGLAEDLPQLAGAELGWVLDERKLFIGNGDIIDGAPVVGNTQILTEFSDILALSATYTYKGEDAGYIVETGANQEAVLRSMQHKFDDVASVKDFGAFGDDDGLGGGTDDTDAINRALQQLFCYTVDPALNAKNNPQARRSLYFPAGIYKVTGKIKIPPHAKIWGDGLTSSIIKFYRAPDISVSQMEDGERYQISFVGTSTLPGVVDDIFVNSGGPITDGSTGLVRAVPAVLETADSNHISGIQIGLNNAELPTGIEMMTMSIETTESNSLLRLNSASTSGFSYLGLHGSISSSVGVQVIGDETAAVELTGPVADITINKLHTRGTTYGLKADGDTKGLVLENSGLNLHYKGVYITNTTLLSPAMIVGVRYKIIEVSTSDFTAGGATYNRPGETFTFNGNLVTGQGTVISMDVPSPTGIVISRNIFDDIAREGIHYENVLFNSTGYNVFYNVANDFSADGVYPVVHFETDQCVSVGDLFEREIETPTAPRIMLAGNGGIALDGSYSIHLGAYERQSGIVATLAAGVADETIFVFDETVASSYRVDYNIARGGETRLGRLYVSNNGTGVTYNDEYTESAPTGIVLNVVPNPEVNTASDVQFTSTTGDAASMAFSVVRLD